MFLMCMCSAQRSAVRVRSMTEELEETRHAFKEAQEKATRSQTSYTKLVHSTLKPWKFNAFFMVTIYTNSRSLWSSEQWDWMPEGSHQEDWRQGNVDLNAFAVEKQWFSSFNNIFLVSTQNEKLTFERTCWEEGINKLRKVNAELRVGTDHWNTCYVFVSPWWVLTTEL